MRVEDLWKNNRSIKIKTKTLGSGKPIKVSTPRGREGIMEGKIIEVYEKIKDEGYKKVLFTSDIHGKIEELKNILQVGRRKGVEITIDLGDAYLLGEVKDPHYYIGKQQEKYNEISIKEAGVLGITIPALYLYVGPRLENLIIGNILPVHSIWNKSSFRAVAVYRVVGDYGFLMGEELGRGKGMEYDPSFLKKIKEKSEFLPFFICKGHDHKAFYTDSVDPLEEEFDMYMRSLQSKIHTVEQRRKIVVSEKGLYFLNPGSVADGFAMIFSVLGKQKYLIEWITTTT